MAKQIRSWSLTVKVAGSIPLTAEQLLYLAALCWLLPVPENWRTLLFH